MSEPVVSELGSPTAGPEPACFMQAGDDPARFYPVRSSPLRRTLLTAVILSVALHLGIGVLVARSAEEMAGASEAEPVVVELITEEPAREPEPESAEGPPTAEMPPLVTSPGATTASPAPHPQPPTHPATPTSAAPDAAPDHPRSEPPRESAPPILLTPPAPSRPQVTPKRQAVAPPERSQPEESRRPEEAETTQALVATSAEISPLSSPEQSAATDAAEPGSSVEANVTPVTNSAATPATTVTGPSAPSTSGGRASTQAGRSSALAQYNRAIWQRIAAHKPKGVHLPGRTLVSFTVAANGALQGAAIAQPSGNDELDRLALSTVRAAAPLPPLPPALGTQPLSFEIPFAFH